MITYRVLSVNEVDLPLFAFFKRTQNVTKCWRKMGNEWSIQDAPFVDDWSDQEYQEGVQYLKNLIHSNGYVVGGFHNGNLKGFASVEPTVFGDHEKYVDLSNIHVSQDMRGQGIGRELFRLAKKWAKGQHAEKLYISAHSAIESQAFYRAMGCVEAVEYDKKHTEKEPFDCQLECML